MPHPENFGSSVARLTDGVTRSFPRARSPANNNVGAPLIPSGDRREGSGHYFASATATYAPSPISVNPVAIRCLRLSFADDRSRAPIGAAIRVTIKSHKVFRLTEIAPSARNCQNTPPLARLTNCGMNARKNNAVFGFSASVAIPCQKGLRRVVASSCTMPVSLARSGASVLPDKPSTPRLHT